MAGIPQAAFDFLKQLKENNNRDWFNLRKAHFKIIEKDTRAVFTKIDELLSKHDDISNWRPYRIYRNLQFSKDKTPYKRFMAAEYNRRKPVLRGGYYIHVEPDNCSFIEVGFFEPNPNDLKRMRREWETDTTEIRKILRDKNFKKYWPAISGERLKSAPMGFDRNHPDIDLINLKQWIFRHDFSDEEVLKSNFTSVVDKYFGAVRPFFDYMSAVLTTNLNGESLTE